MENIISASFEHYTKQYNAMIGYCDILDDTEERIDGIGFVRIQLLALRGSKKTYKAMKINGICIDWHEAIM